MKTNSRASPSRSQKFTTISSLASVFFISFVTAKVFAIIHASNFNVLAEAAQGVLAHKPHWIAYQNRLLGPYSVYAISLLDLSFVKALIGFSVLAIIYQTVILYALLLKFTKNNFSLTIRYIIYFSFMFLGIQDYWFYTWDSLEAILFVLFSWGIWEKKPTLYFIFLFFVALVNKESAIFIAVFLIIDSFHIQRNKQSIMPKIKFISVSKLLIGLFLVFLGAAYTKLIRDYLFISSSLLDVGNDNSHKILGNHFNFFENLQTLFVKNLLSPNIINSFFIIGLIAYLSWSFNKLQEQDYKAFIIMVLIIFSIFAFGLINESRIYLPLLPFIIFLHLRQHQQKTYHKV